MARRELAYTRIGRPFEEHGRLCVSPAWYLEMQKRHIAALRHEYPALPLADPFEEPEPGVPQIMHGVWKIQCACDNWPVYDPDWQLACCFRCGAIHQVAPPADWRAIEAVLLCRTAMHQRNYLIGETLASLRAENIAHEDPVPDTMGVN